MEKLTRVEAFSLALDAYHKRSSKEEFSAEQRVEGLRNYLADLNKNYRANKDEIFQIVEDVVNEILPKKVLETVSQFAEFRTFDNNTQVRFRVKQTHKIKAVEVAVGGSVERVRVDQGWITVGTEAVQCKVYEEYERVIGGLCDWNELINLVVDAINTAIMEKVYQALIGVYADLPTVNAHTSDVLEVAELDKIINVVKAYGAPIIMGSSLAVQQIPVSFPTAPSEADKNDMRNKGFIGVYKGLPVVELPNSFEDTDNTVKVFDDQYLFVIPAGSEKIVKVALEGGLITRESQGQDWTSNFEAYQKVGTAVYFVNNIGMYKISSLV
jgi:hypothetical protein